MSYENYRHPFTGETFNDVLLEQFRRTPWLLLSGAVHGLVIFILLVFMKTAPAPTELEQASVEMDPIEEMEEVEEVDPPDEQQPEDVEVERDVEVEQTAEVDSVEHDQPYEELFGETENDSPAKASDRQDTDSIGLGGGVGGGGGRGGPGTRKRPGGKRPSEVAVDKALEWFKIHQSPDGSWDADGFMHNGDPGRGELCDGKGGALYDVGVTGLALLCYLGAGETHRVGTYKRTVARGLKWLREQQDAEGCFGSRSVSNFTYSHSIATIAMCEAYGMTKSPVLKKAAERAYGFVLQCQNPYKAWRYGEANGQNDTSVTGWMVMALKAARDAGFGVDDRNFAWALDYIEEMTDDETGRTGYTKRGEPPVRETGQTESFPASESESLTAVGVLTRIFCGQDPREHPMIRLGVENVLSKKLPVWDQARGAIDMYYWYYASFAMYQVGGDAWRRWNRAMNDAIIETQREDGNFSGSWDPVGAWGDSGGRVYSTALMTLCLEVYYRYGRVFGAR